MRLIVVCIVALGAAVGGTSQQRIQEQSTPEYLSRDVVLPSGQFSYKAAEDVCRSILSGTRHLKFVQVRVHTSGLPLPKPDHTNYSFWRRWYDKLAASPRAAAEMTAVNGDAVLRYRSENGEISETVLSGRNPLRIELGGIRVDILEIAIAAVPLRRGPVKAQASIFGITSASLSEKIGLQVFASLAGQIPVPITELAVRNDHWFINDMQFPIVDSFSPPAPPPSEEEYAESVTLRCGDLGGKLACNAMKAGK